MDSHEKKMKKFNEKLVKSIEADKKSGVVMSAVMEIGNKWYFWNETYTNKIGPYTSKEECLKAMRIYSETL